MSSGSALNLGENRSVYGGSKSLGSWRDKATGFTNGQSHSIYGGTKPLRQHQHGSRPTGSTMIAKRKLAYTRVLVWNFRSQDCSGKQNQLQTLAESWSGTSSIGFGSRTVELASVFTSIASVAVSFVSEFLYICTCRGHISRPTSLSSYDHGARSPVRPSQTLQRL